MPTPSMVKSGHAIRRMTQAQRVEWFGRSDVCNEQQHERCSSWTGRVLHLGYDKLKIPCGCGCHFPTEEEG